MKEDCTIQLEIYFGNLRKDIAGNRLTFSKNNQILVQNEVKRSLIYRIFF